MLNVVSTHTKLIIFSGGKWIFAPTWYDSLVLVTIASHCMVKCIRLIVCRIECIPNTHLKVCNAANAKKMYKTIQKTKQIPFFDDLHYDNIFRELRAKHETCRGKRTIVTHTNTHSNTYFFSSNVRFAHIISLIFNLCIMLCVCFEHVLCFCHFSLVHEFKNIKFDCLLV